MDLNTIYNYLDPVRRIKAKKREGWLRKGFEADSIAEHVLDVMHLGLYLAMRENVNQEKVLKMLMIHDNVMGYMDDVTPIDTDNRYKDKRELEEEAFKMVIKNTPVELQELFQLLWDEFNQVKTPEAHVAREADKLATLMQGLYYERQAGIVFLDEFLTTYKDIFKTKTGVEIFELLVAER